MCTIEWKPSQQTKACWKFSLFFRSPFRLIRWQFYEQLTDFSVFCSRVNAWIWMCHCFKSAITIRKWIFIRNRNIVAEFMALPLLNCTVLNSRWKGFKQTFFPVGFMCVCDKMGDNCDFVVFNISESILFEITHKCFNRNAKQFPQPFVCEATIICEYHFIGNKLRHKCGNTEREQECRGVKTQCQGK